VASVVFYDGVCGLCSRLVRFLLRRDHDGRLLFAPLQGGLARAVLGRHGYDPSDLDTVYVIADRRAPDRPRRPDSARWGGRERVLAKSRAILHALGCLGGGWRVLARLGSLVPVVLADAVYDAVATRRYRTFGKLETCPIPPPEWRARFIEEDQAETFFTTE
jgi:predicted DCC family thiol-disulfide oxidoreductase YuxK